VRLSCSYLVLPQRGNVSLEKLFEKNKSIFHHGSGVPLHYQKHAKKLFGLNDY